MLQRRRGGGAGGGWVATPAYQRTGSMWPTPCLRLPLPCLALAPPQPLYGEEEEEEEERMATGTAWCFTGILLILCLLLLRHLITLFAAPPRTGEATAVRVLAYCLPLLVCWRPLFPASPAAL